MGFEDKLAQGRVGEGAISKWLQGRGHSVSPAYEVERDSGKGPQLFAAAGDLVLPDLLAFRAGGAMWFEAKNKTRFAWHRLTQSWTTGIDLRHYGEYQEVAIRTGLPVWLLFLHLRSTPSDADIAHRCPPRCPTGLFGNELGRLTQTESHRSNRYGRSGMVYWAHDALRLLASVGDMG
jgi:hypothetical protein